jgi:hypothetical protein
MLLELAIGAVGIISTFLAWKLNPRRVLYAELDSIYKEIESWSKVRDQALSENNSDNLTIAVSSIIRLHNRKNEILQRFR